MPVRKTQKGANLRRWFKEDWRTPSGDKDYSGGDTTFRPTKKISSKTLSQPAKRPPKTGFDLSKAQKDLGYNPKTLEESLDLLN